MNKDRYAKVNEMIREAVADFNEVLGLGRAPKYDEPRVSFGYIGNGRMTPNGWDLSGVIHYVFLPHPGRVGTNEDSIGGFVEGDLEGAAHTLVAVRGAVAGARLAKSGVLA